MIYICKEKLKGTIKCGDGIAWMKYITMASKV